MTVPELIADYTQAKETLSRQITYLEAGNKIYPAGASETEAAGTTATWLVKLKKFRSEFDGIIADLQQELR
jgi:hypothetical protein